MGFHWYVMAGLHFFLDFTAAAIIWNLLEVVQQLKNTNMGDNKLVGSMIEFLFKFLFGKPLIYSYLLAQTISAHGPLVGKW